ncbi:MAG: hypothetical protein ACRDWH_02100 [Acidimicrobiia bacterium]
MVRDTARPDFGTAIHRAAARLAVVTRPQEVTAEIGSLALETVGTSSAAIAQLVGEGEMEITVISGSRTPPAITVRRMPLSAHHPLVDTVRDGASRMFESVASLL